MIRYLKSKYDCQPPHRGEHELSATLWETSEQKLKILLKFRYRLQISTKIIAYLVCCWVTNKTHHFSKIQLLITFLLITKIQQKFSKMLRSMIFSILKNFCWILIINKKSYKQLYFCEVVRFVGNPFQCT